MSLIYFSRCKLFRVQINFKTVSISANIFLILNQAPQKRYELIDPVAVDPSDTDLNAILQYNSLRGKIINDIRNVTALENAGVYVQDIRTGSWMGINERQTFFPASLLKIPVMMVILKKVDRGEMKLTDSVTLMEEDLDGGAGDLYISGAGATRTVWELIKEMILSSDNTAKNALKRYISPAEMNSIFEHVGISNPYINSSAGVSPRGFNRLFKSLYYSTYLTPEMSERAIDISMDTTREDLLTQGTPVEVRVAHKYGQTLGQLHDCGIVYHPTNPYFICIMTKDGDHSIDSELIIKISQDVFDFANNK